MRPCYMLVLVMAVFMTGMMVFSGCGGSDKGFNPVIKSGDGSITSSDTPLADGSYGDTIHFTTERAGVVIVSMSSSDVDSYVVVWSGSADDYTSYTLIGEDDDSGIGLDSLFGFLASANSTYTVRFCTSGASDFGPYKYLISYGDNRSMRPLIGDEPAKPVVEIDKHVK